MFKVAIGFSIVLSFICMLLAAAPFTPAIGVSFIMLLFAGFIGYKGLPSIEFSVAVNKYSRCYWKSRYGCL